MSVMHQTRMLSAACSNQNMTWTQTRTLRRFAPPPGKPPNLPPAQSKRYEVVRPVNLTAEEVRDLAWQRHAYNDAVASIRHFIKTQYKKESSPRNSISLLKRAEQREFTALLRENDELNKKTAEIRDEKEKEMLDEFDLNLAKEIGIHQRQAAKQLHKNTLLVKTAIENQANFVTEANLLQKVTDAIENPKELEFAVDLNGNAYQAPLPVAYLDETPIKSEYQHKHSLMASSKLNRDLVASPTSKTLMDKSLDGDNNDDVDDTEWETETEQNQLNDQK